MAITTVRKLLENKGGLIWSIKPGATVFEALRMMADKDVGALVIMDGEKLVGILSERDYARKVALEGKTSKAMKVSDIMTTRLFTVHPDQTIEECMALMTAKHIRHLPVMENDCLVGVISIGDVVKAIIYQQRETIKSLERYMTS